MAGESVESNKASAKKWTSHIQGRNKDGHGDCGKKESHKILLYHHGWYLYQFFMRNKLIQRIPWGFFFLDGRSSNNSVLLSLLNYKDQIKDWSSMKLMSPRILSTLSFFFRQLEKVWKMILKAGLVQMWRQLHWCGGCF